MLASDIFKYIYGLLQVDCSCWTVYLNYFIKKHRNVLLSCQSKEQTVEAVFISINNEVRNSNNVF